MTDSGGIAPTLMATHADALRQLALRLVRDPHEAEDALQETWLRALESPPAGTQRLRGWLETVLRNVVRRRARQQRRSESRERQVARREASAATVDIVARRQTLQALTEAVLSLPPAQQELVFARYFEGLPPRAIARRVGRPVGAVHRDLDRARRALRQRLRASLGDGSWRGSLAALCGWRLWPLRDMARRQLITTGLIMTMKKQLVFGMVAALAVALVLITDPGAPYGETSPPAPDVAAARAMTAGDRLADEPGQAERTAIEAATSESSVLAPYEFSMEVHARDLDDLPVAGATVWVGPARHGLNAATTDEDGVLRLRWRGRVPSMTMVIGSPNDLSQGERLQRRTVSAGAHSVMPLRLESEPVRVNSLILLSIGENGSVMNVAKSRTPSVHFDDEGTAWFVTGSRPEPRLVSGNFKLSWGPSPASVRYSVSLEHPTVEAADDSSGAKPVGTVRGRLLDHDGGPAANALVVIGPERDRRSAWRTRTASDGTFRVDGVPAGPMFLRAGGGDHGLAHGDIQVVAHQEVAWHGQLDRGLELTARLVDEDGKPLVGWQVEAVPHRENQPWIDGAVTDDGGRFAIPNVTHQPYSLRVRPAKGALFGRRLDGVWPGTDVALNVPDAKAGEGQIRAQPVGADGEPRKTAELRFWLDAADEGVFVRRAGEEPVQRSHLCPGLYTVVAGDAGVARHDVTQVHVGAGTPTEIGAIELPEPARVGLPEGFDPGEKTFSLLRLHEAVPSRAGELSHQQRELILPAGDYLIGDADAHSELEMKAGSNQLPPKEDR